VELILDYEQEPVDVVLIALAVNLAINKRNSLVMVEGGRLPLLMDQAFRNMDPLLMKVIRNIAQHDACKSLFVVCTQAVDC